MSGELSNTNGSNGSNVLSGGGVKEPRTEEQAERVLAARPLTLEYRPSVSIGAPGMLDGGDGGRFDDLWAHLRDVEWMLSHPDVIIPYGMYLSAISTVKFKVKAGKEEHAAEAHDILTRLWTQHFKHLQRRCDYGWIGFEVDYDVERGWIDFASLIDLFPLDCFALSVRGEYRGFRLKGSTGSIVGANLSAGVVDLWGPGKWPSKGLWLTHDRRWNRFYGRSQLHGAWRPWRRLAGRDMAEDVIDGAVYRRAYQGPTIRYPETAFRRLGGGELDLEAARNEALLMSQNLKAGGSLALPNTRDANGNYLWEVEWTDSNLTNLDALLSYEDNLQKQISRGVGVPPELFEASQTGSGYSGRIIPLQGFYDGQTQNARDLVRQLVEQVVEPILRWNHGDDAWCEAEVEVTLPKILSGEQPEQAQGAPPMPAGMPPGGAPPEGQEQAAPPGEEQGDDLGPLADLLPDGGEETGAQLSLSDDGEWTLSDGEGEGGWELAAATPRRYEMREVKSGAHKGKLAHYDTHEKKFKPVGWRPGQAQIEGGIAGHAAQLRQQQEAPAPQAPPAQQAAPPPAPAPQAKQYQPPPVPKQPKAPKQPTQGPQTAPQFVAPAPPQPAAPALPRQGRSGAEVRQYLAQKGQAPPAQPPAAEKPKKPKQVVKIPQQHAEAFRKTRDAASRDVAQPSHPLNPARGMREKLVTAKIPGGGRVKTLRSTPENPLSHADHNAMSEMHARAAAVLRYAGREQEANDQAHAAQYHEQQAGKAAKAGRRDVLPQAQPQQRPRQVSPPQRQQQRPALNERLRPFLETPPATPSERRRGGRRTLSLAYELGPDDEGRTHGDPEATLDAVVPAVRKLCREARTALLSALTHAPKEQALAVTSRWSDEWQPRMAEAFAYAGLAASLEGMASLAGLLEADDSSPLTEPTDWIEYETADDLPLVRNAVERLAGMDLLSLPSFLAARQKAQAAGAVAAHAQADAVLGRVRTALSHAVGKGGTLEAFRRDVAGSLEGTALSPSDVETIFRTNVMAAYSDGQEQLLSEPDVGELFPYVLYSATHDSRTRPDHLAMEKHGIGGGPVYRRDDPVFQMFRPPWGHNCRCTWTPLSVASAARHGVKEAIDWDRFGRPPARPEWVPMPPFRPDATIAALRGVTLSAAEDEGVVDLVMRLVEGGDPSEGYEMAATARSRPVERAKEASLSLADLLEGIADE